MLKHPLITKLGLDYFSSPYGLVVLAKDVERVMREAPIVLNLENYAHDRWFLDDGGYIPECKQRSARLLLIEEIKPKCEHPIEKLHFPVIGLKATLDNQNDTEVESISKMRLVCECGAKLKAKWEVAK